MPSRKFLAAALLGAATAWDSLPVRISEASPQGSPGAKKRRKARKAQKQARKGGRK